MVGWGIIFMALDTIGRIAVIEIYIVPSLDNVAFGALTPLVVVGPAVTLFAVGEAGMVKGVL